MSDTRDDAPAQSAQSGQTDIDFAVEAIDRLTLDVKGDLAGRDLMSPYVWALDKDRFAMLVRGVPADGDYKADTGMIWYGESDDGLHFVMDEAPAIAPGKPGEPHSELDAGGCEDPTLVIVDGRWVVYYTGVDAQRSGGQMLYATGTGPHDLAKQGIALASSKTEGNTKEATIERTAEGRWRLFYEFAREVTPGNWASLIGLALGDGVGGPWHEQPQPFAPRDDRWDAWHLSTGPMLTDVAETPVMFYNGATQDARWRIGWVAFDRDCTRVVDRCIEPLIDPPPRPDRMQADIAFAASCVVTGPGRSQLYYSIGDRALERATIRRFG